MTTIDPKVLPRVWETIKCLGITKKGTPCNNKRTMVRHCDYKGVCKKHLTQMPKFKFRPKTPNELPDNLVKLLPYELWLDIFERLPKRVCCIVSQDNTCHSCGTFYKNP